VVAVSLKNTKSVADEDFDFEEQLREVGFSESEIDELLAQGMLGVMLNMLTDTYDIPVEKPFPGEDVAEA
jgi:hypothetical protein